MPNNFVRVPENILLVRATTIKSDIRMARFVKLIDPDRPVSGRSASVRGMSTV
ncbi:hypothetical protein WEB32_11535 [Streptomyces netropsis]|uniref:Uncharacterized protein n=1 Tax=Streptomyces netropsis TaxID=55404 RepID=A0A7W7L737_STRNE|nr:hypothetical protein [Streptomyces netropsis]MBB4884323.1 hypothetical protein [Streptomyces netropsis]